MSKCCAIALGPLEGGREGERGDARVYCVWSNGALQGLDLGNYLEVWEEGPGCCATGCYWEGGSAHKPARRAPAPELLLGFHLGHSFALLVAEQQRSKKLKGPETGKFGGGGGGEGRKPTVLPPFSLKT